MTTGCLQENIDLGSLNTFAVPSTASKYLEVKQISDLLFARDYAIKNQLKVLALGEGSNILLPTKIPALVLKVALCGKKLVDEDSARPLVEISAGENWHQAVIWCHKQGFYGLENLALIPGTVGAAPVQNIGAYGVELSDYLESLEYFDFTQGKLITLSAADCGFSYRDSIFKTKLKDRTLITRIWLRLKGSGFSEHGRSDYPALKGYLEKHGLEAAPENIFKAVCAIRQSRLPDPEQIPNLGSFFHNPVVEKIQYQLLLEQFPDMPGYAIGSKHIKVPAAWLIESVGLKGQEVGGLKVSDMHALVLTNPNRLDADAVMISASVIQQKVKDAFGVQLNIEPRVYTNL